MVDVVANAVKAILPAVETAKGITGFVENFDPMNVAITAVADAVGLPPEVRDVVKIAAGAMTGNVLLAADGALGLAEQIGHNAPAETEYFEPKGGSSHGGYCAVSSSSAASTASKQAWLDHEYLRALRAIDRNWWEFDRGGMVGLTDGTAEGRYLEYLLKHADPEVRDAAQFFIDHPEYLQQLDAVCKKDGKFSRDDVRAEIERVKSGAPGIPGAAEDNPLAVCDANRPTKHEPVKLEPWGGADDASRSVFGVSIQDIINNPSLTIEEKIMLILELVMRSLDEQLQDTAAKLGERAQQRVDLAEAASKEGATAADKKKLAAFDTSSEQLQMQLQRLMEKRAQMFQLMSNLSSNFNEMALCAIQNLGRA